MIKMDRKEQIERHKKNVKAAFEYAQKGGAINLSALMGGHEEVLCNDIDGIVERKCYSDGWKLNPEEEARCTVKVKP